MTGLPHSQPDKTELRHTPTPWCLSGEPLRSRLIMREVPGMCDGGDAYCVAEAHWHSLLPIEEAKANADFIVEAVNSYASLKSQVERMTALEMRVIALEQVISDEVYPENCSDDCNRMLLESAIESHHRRIKARSALSLEDRK